MSLERSIKLRADFPLMTDPKTVVIGTKKSQNIHMSDDTTELLYKNTPHHYADWNVYNDPSGQKQGGRFRSDVLLCNNNKCPSKGRFISEREAFYLFAKQPIWKRLSGGIAGLCICPFCGGKDLEPITPGKW